MSRHQKPSLQVLVPMTFLQAAESGRASIVVDKEDVLTKIGDLLKKQDLSKYVL